MAIDRLATGAIGAELLQSHAVGGFRGFWGLGVRGLGVLGFGGLGFRGLCLEVSGV